MVPTRRPSIALLTIVAVAAVPAAAVAGSDYSGRHGAGHPPGGTTPTAAPSTIALPNGWQPEGVAAGPGGQLYIGSIPTGAVYRADPRTGAGAVLVPAHDGRAATGIKIDHGKIVVSGGKTGHAYVYDAKTGADVADITLTTGTSFINDVTIAGHSAYFTDSLQQQLYRVSLGDERGGKGRGAAHGRAAGRHAGKSNGNGGQASRLHHGQGDTAKAAAYTSTPVKITGDFVYDADPASNDANGIVALPGGKELLVVQSSTGKLFKVNGTTGVSVQVPISGGDLANGDGLLLAGRTLYVVQNRLNQVAVVKLDARASTGTIERTITNPAFRVPTTLASVGRSLFAVNARFGTPATPTTDYDVVRFTP